MFYVYLHLQADQPVPFYVGKGMGERAYARGNRSKFWHRVVAKHGWDTLILEDGLSEQEAHDLEKHYIKWFGRRSNGSGTLVNLTDGGDGCAGMKHSEATKAVLSAKNSIVKRGTKLSAETRAKIGAAHRGKVVSDITRQRLSLSHMNPSPEVRAKMSAAAKARAPLSAESRKKAAISNTGRKRSLEARERMSAAQKGRVVSPETRAKISATKRARNTQ